MVAFKKTQKHEALLIDVEHNGNESYSWQLDHCSNDEITIMRIKLPPIAYALLIAHFVFFSIVGGFAIYRMGH